MTRDAATTLEDAVNVGRLSTFSRLTKSMVRNYLLKLSREYMADGAAQMVVFSFDHIGHSINLYRFYENDGLNLIAHWLERNNLIRACAVDIGANIGNHSLFFSRHYRTVFAFEPNPRTYEVLKLNSKLANNIITYNFGLSDTSDSVTLTQDNLNVGHSAIASRIERPQSSVTQFDITVRALDEVADVRQAEIALIKIDVEGHELPALIGATEIIKKNRPIILFEQHANELRDGSSSVIDYLRSLGYRRFAVLQERPTMPQRMPRMLRIPLTICARMLFGTTYFIKEVESFKTAFYSLIIAVPD
jgi:FkbM family methyltransferase